MTFRVTTVPVIPTKFVTPVFPIQPTHRLLALRLIYRRRTVSTTRRNPLLILVVAYETRTVPRATLRLEAVILLVPIVPFGVKSRPRLTNRLIVLVAYFTPDILVMYDAPPLTSPCVLLVLSLPRAV